MFARRVTATILNRPVHAGSCGVCDGWTVRVIVGLVDVIDGLPVGVTCAEICTGCGARVIESERRVP